MNRGDALSDELAAEVVLASDCLYEPSQYAYLLTSLLALTNRPSARPVTVVLAYKQRLPAYVCCLRSLATYY